MDVKNKKSCKSVNGIKLYWDVIFGYLFSSVIMPQNTVQTCFVLRPLGSR